MRKREPQADARHAFGLVGAGRHLSCTLQALCDIVLGHKIHHIRELINTAPEALAHHLAHRAWQHSTLLLHAHLKVCFATFVLEAAEVQEYLPLSNGLVAEIAKRRLQINDRDLQFWGCFVDIGIQSAAY